PVAAPWVSHGRHDPPRHQQPGRLHDQPGRGAVVGVRDGRGEDGAGADLPRERRRPRGLRPGGAAGLRLPAAVPQGRRHRHGLLPDVPTAVADKALLDRIASVVTAGPEGFHINPKLAKVFEARTKLYAEGQVDWSLGEAFAYGTLLAEGHDVRLAGQDSSRGT